MANAPHPIPGPQAAAADQAAARNNALWYTFKGIGRAYLVRRGSDAALTADTAGVHGYSTIEQAYANPNTVNPASQAAISQWDSDASLPAGGGVLGVVETVNITAPSAPGGQPSVSTQQNPATAAAGQLTGLAAIGDFFQRLTQANTWVRLAKVIIGGSLLIFGLVHMTGADSAAARAVKMIPLPI